MPFPRKFQAPLETEPGDVESPDYVWMVYAVCAVEADSCGWGGWAIEAPFKRDGGDHPTGTGDRLLTAMDQLTCPRCGRDLFRTSASLRLEPSADQEPVHGRPGVDYETTPME